MKRNFAQFRQGGGESGEAPSLPIIVKLVVPHDRSGSVIGKGGEVVKGIRASTGARIKIEDTVPGLKERAVTVSASDKPGDPACPTDEALIRLIARAVELEGPDGQTTPPAEVEVKIIVDRGFMGQIVGKGGSQVTQIRAETGASINTTSPATRSPLVADAEQLITVSGSYAGVKHAVHLIMEKVRIAIAKGQLPLALTSAPPPALPSQPPVAAAPAPGLPPAPAAAPPVYGAPPAVAAAPAAPPPVQVETSYRVLMPDYKVGGLIGRGGEHLRRIRTNTGAEVHVDAKIDGVPERMVICKSQEPSDSHWCGAAEALMKCTQHLLHEKPGSNEGQQGDPHGPKQVRLVAQARQMGAVIGMKGATIRQLAQDFRCKLNVIKGDLAPGLGTLHDEVLMVEGLPHNILSAVRVITMLLRSIIVRQQVEQRPPTLAPPPAVPLPAPAPLPAAPAAPAPSPWAPRAAPAPSPYPPPAYASAPPAPPALPYSAPMYGSVPPPAPAPHAAVPPPAYAAVPPPASYGSAPPAPAPPAQPAYPPRAPTFVHSSTPYTAEPGAVGGAPTISTSAPPPTYTGGANPLAPPPLAAPAPPSAPPSNDPWAAYHAAQAAAAATQPQQAPPTGSLQYAPPAAAPTQTQHAQQAQPPSFSTPAPGAPQPTQTPGYASDASALGAQLYGSAAGVGANYPSQGLPAGLPPQQLPQQPQQQPQQQQQFLMYANGASVSAPSSAPMPQYAPVYTQQQQPTQQTQPQYGYMQQQPQQQASYGGFAASYVPSPSPAR